MLPDPVHPSALLTIEKWSILMDVSHPILIPSSINDFSMDNGQIPSSCKRFLNVLMYSTNGFPNFIQVFARDLSVFGAVGYAIFSYCSVGI